MEKNILSETSLGVEGQITETGANDGFFIEKWDLLVQKTLEERNLLGINVNTLTDDINALSKEELISLIENIKPKDVKKALSKISS